MRHKNYVPVNELTYGDKIEPVPFIPVSGNGVHYNPYQAKRKTFVSLGRGAKGDTEAEKVQWDWLMGILAAHEWQIPDEIDTPNDPWVFASYDNQPSLAVGYWDPGLGHIMSCLSFPQQGEGKGYVVFSIHELAFALALRKRPVKPWWVSNGRAVPIDFVPGDDLPLKFKADPFRVGYELWSKEWDVAPSVDSLMAVLNPPDMSKAHYVPDGRPAQGPWTRQTRHADLYKDPEAIKASAFEGLPILQRALGAFSHLGLTISVETATTREGKNLLTGLTIYVPEGGEHNALGHGIYISGDGVSIECGYVENDDKHREYQMREARKFLEHVQEYTEMSFEIKRPNEGEE